MPPAVPPTLAIVPHLALPAALPAVPTHALPNVPTHAALPNVPTHALPGIGQQTRGRGRSVSPVARGHRRVISSDAIEGNQGSGDSTPRRKGSAGQRLSSFEEERKQLFKSGRTPDSRQSRETASNARRQERRSRSVSKKRAEKAVTWAPTLAGNLKQPPPPPPDQVTPAPPMEEIDEPPREDSDSDMSLVNRLDAVAADFTWHLQGFAALQREMRGDSNQAAQDDDKKPAAHTPASAPTFAASGTDNMDDGDDDEFMDPSAPMDDESFSSFDDL